MEVDVRSWRDDGDRVRRPRRRTAQQTIVTGRGCLAVPVPLADYHDPDDLRVLFSEIHRAWTDRQSDDEPTSCPA